MDLNETIKNLFGGETAVLSIIPAAAGDYVFKPWIDSEISEKTIASIDRIPIVAYRIEFTKYSKGGSWDAVPIFCLSSHDERFSEKFEAYCRNGVFIWNDMTFSSEADLLDYMGLELASTSDEEPLV